MKKVLFISTLLITAIPAFSADSWQKTDYLPFHETTCQIILAIFAILSIVGFYRLLDDGKKYMVLIGCMGTLTLSISTYGSIAIVPAIFAIVMFFVIGMVSFIFSPH